MKCGEVHLENGKFEYRCEQCGSSLAMPFIDIWSHVQSHLPHQYIFKPEDGIIDNSTLLLNNSQSLDPNNFNCLIPPSSPAAVTPYHCDSSIDCDDVVKDEYPRDEDITQHHPPAATTTENTTTTNHNNTTGTETKPSEPSASQLIRSLHKSMCPNPYKIVNGVKIPKTIECDICGAKMAYRYQLVPHMECHVNGKSYTCSHCTKTFNTRRAMRKHENIHKNLSKRYNCEVCGWLFREKDGLTQHMRKHTGEKPYKCKLCERSFFQSSYLNIHMRTHSGERPYRCELCNVGFTSQNLLTRHIRRHRNERPYNCDMCDEAFFSRLSLQEHKRLHTGEQPFLCVTCGKSFTRRSTYRNHLQTHANNKG